MNKTLRATGAIGATRIKATTSQTMPASRLGGPSGLPRFRWRQPIPDKNTPPDAGIDAEESAHSFQWSKDTILPYRVYDDYDRAQRPGELPLVTLDNGRLRVSAAPAVSATAEAVDCRFPEAELANIDAFLADVSRQPVDRPLAAGSAWGRRHEKLTGRRLAAGLDFWTPTTSDCWDDLLAEGRFFETSLATTPEDFTVSDLWVEALEQSRQKTGETWLHALLLGIAALDRDDREKARELFDRSVAVRPTWLGWRQCALVAATDDLASCHYLAAWGAGGAPMALAVEIVGFLLHRGKFAVLQDFVAALPKEVLEQERIVLGRALLAARHGALDELETLLDRRFATIREGETLLEDQWPALQKGRLEQALGRLPTAGELTERLRAHPLAEHLDFRMRIAAADEEH